LHCLIPAGVLTPAGEWSALNGDYLFPVRALSRRFRGCMVSALRAAYEEGELTRIENSGEIDEVLSELMGKEWVVFSKPCGGRSESVIDYLGRYTYRIAISNERIIAVDDTTVKFTCKQYRQDGRRKTMELPSEEFIRRLLMHVVPKGLMRVRHYGFLSNRTRREKIGLISAWLNQPKEPETKVQPDRMEGAYAEYVCRICKNGTMVPITPANDHGPPRHTMH